MCTFRSDHEVMVCDVAIANVQSHLREESQEVEFVTVQGQGTLVRATSRIDARVATTLAARGAHFSPEPRCVAPIYAAHICDWRGSTAPTSPMPISATPKALPRRNSIGRTAPAEHGCPRV